MGIEDVLPRRPLGKTGLTVTPLCIGGGPLGSMPRAFGYAVPPERGIETVREVLRGPINFLDTSANYSDGESERRIGLALAAAGGVPADFVVATKVDRDPATGDFSGDQVLRSAEGSMRRLGLDRFPLLYLHDPEHIGFDEAMASTGPVKALVRLKEEGIAEHIGVAGGPVGLLGRFLRTGLFEAVITHNRWTLVDRSADDLLDEAMARGVAVINGAPFGGGVLAKGRAEQSSYAYREAPEDVARQIDAIEEACRAYEVPVAAAALQFSTRDPRISSTIVGVSRPERVRQTVELASWRIPLPLWQQLQGLAVAPKYWQW